VVIVLSTHIVEDVTELCSNTAVIAGGEAVATVQPAEAIGELRGKVYRTKTEKAALAELEVMSSKLVGGQRCACSAKRSAAAFSRPPPTKPRCKTLAARAAARCGLCA